MLQNSLGEHLKITAERGRVSTLARLLERRLCDERQKNLFGGKVMKLYGVYSNGIG
jgi:hypothetical protein